MKVQGLARAITRGLRLGLLLSVGAGIALQAQASAKAISRVDVSSKFEACQVSGFGGKVSRRVDCATVQVPIDYSSAGESLEVFVVRFKARSQEPQSDAVLMLAGGPGQSASEGYLFADHAFRKLNKDRDIYLIDQRGTGRSSPLTCPSIRFDGLAQDFESESDRKQFLASVEGCLSEYDYPAGAFTTSVAINDFEFVRNLFGVTQWNLIGTSYGSRVAQHYMRRHPNAIRTVILDGVVYPEHNLGPMIALESQAALERLIRRCEQDEHCAKSFPNISEGVHTLVAKLKKEAIDIEFESFQSGKKETMHFGIANLSVFVRLALYSDEQMALLPVMLHQAYAKNNFAPVARSYQNVMSALKKGINMGMHNSVVCNEDVAFYTSADTDKTEVAKTYMGDALIDVMLNACSVWPKGPVDDDFKMALTSDIPVLALSGSEDPITPPAYAERAIKTLKNSMHIVFPGQGHGVSQIGCGPTLVAKFIDEASTQKLKPSCVEKLKPAPFFMDFNGSAP